MLKLQAWHHGAHVGTLTLNDDGRWQFTYDPAWTSFALSPHLPIGATTNDLAHQRTVEWFFDNLLPEGALRETLAKRETLRNEDSWGLLSRYGQDTAGALSILRDGVTPDVQPKYTPLPTDRMAEMIVRSKQGIPLIAQNGQSRMSLAGGQEKIALHIDNSGNFFMPEGAAASSIILKPENRNPLYAFCPANEWFCMTLADKVGLSAPAADIMSIGPHRVYVVRRYDRVSASDGNIRRLHQIDLCQAMNVPPQKKYEDENGLSARDLFSVAANCRVPAIAKSISMHWLAFNYLVGNGDAHAKNISFLMGGQKSEIAPAYDLLCVDAYHKNRHLTMGIGGQMQAGWIEGCHWDALALENRADPRAMRSIITRLVTGVRKNTESLLSSTKLEPAEIVWLREHVEPVIAERLLFIEEALAQPICNAKTIQSKHGTIPDDILENIEDMANDGGNGSSGGASGGPPTKSIRPK